MSTAIIEGMTCEHCTKAVTMLFETIPGIERVTDIELESGKVTFDGFPQVPVLVAALKEDGYVLISADE